MEELASLLFKAALNVVHRNDTHKLRRYLDGEVEEVRLKLPHNCQYHDDDLELVCKTTTENEFGDADVHIYSEKKSVAKCTFAMDGHYEWHTHPDFRGSGYADIVRTVAEAHSGMMETEMADKTSYGASLERRGYDPLNISLEDFEFAIGEDEFFDETVFFQLNYDRAIERLQGFNQRVD